MLTPPLLIVPFGALVLISATWVVTLRNLFRAALSLGVVLLGVAGLFLTLEAEFLAFVQVLIYVGAILTLIVFAIMLTAKVPGASSAPASRQAFPSAAIAFALFVVLVSSTSVLVPLIEPVTEAVRLDTLGQELVKTLVLPFEIVSLIFVAAVVGAIALAVPRASRRP